MNNVIIIGGGASGLCAAVMAAKNGATVRVIEHKDRVGKKILMTGNGRCNLTNEDISPGKYYSDETGFAWQVISNFDLENTFDFFEYSGITYKSKNGYIYPRCAQASVVLDLLRAKCRELGVRILCDMDVEKINYDDHNFTIYANEQILKSDRLILALGGKSYKKTGSDGSGYKLLKNTPHKFSPMLPALTGLISKDDFFKMIAGVRCDGKVSFFINNKNFYCETGEIQFTEYGLSGIPVFNGSRYISQALNKKEKCCVSIDLFPEKSEDEVRLLLKEKIKLNPGYIISEQLNGFLNKKISLCILKILKINQNKPSCDISENEIRIITEKIKNLKTDIINVKSFDTAQITTGGVLTKDISPDTLESKFIKGLYITGEMLDVDGMCGGYNLQFAWSSGALAGKNAAG